MHYSRNVVLAIAPFLLGVHAAVDLDMDDVPTPCKTICKPIGDLSDKCDVDLKSDIDKDEDHLQNQCICTNQSFDVAKIAAMCADCMHQSQKSKRDDDDDDDDDDHADSDDLEDIDGLLSTCGFSSTQYNSASASSMVAGITVDVTRPTDISQLTTTIDSANPGKGAGSGGNNGGSMTTDSMMSGSSSMMPTPTPTGDSGNGNGGAGGGGSGNDNSSGSNDNQSNGASGGSGGAATESTSSAAGAMPTANAIYAGGLAYAAYLMG